MILEYNYGRDLASGESSYLLDEIAGHCQEINEDEFENRLRGFENLSDTIIFATNPALYRFFEKSKNFRPKWYADSPQLDVKGFEGWYEFKDQLIPIFWTYHRKIDKQILVLNKSKLGKVIQYSPLNEGEDENLLKDIFYINVQAFSENSELLEDFIKKPTTWLQKIGDKQKQREYLQERVLIKIFERFDFNKATNFEGYKLNLSG